MKVADIKKKITPILEKYAIERAGIFGSVARGESVPSSDIDILIQLSEKISLLDFVGIKYELEDVLGHTVDLVEYQSLKPRLRDRILSQEIQIYG